MLALNNKLACFCRFAFVADVGDGLLQPSLPLLTACFLLSNKYSLLAICLWDHCQLHIHTGSDFLFAIVMHTKPNHSFCLFRSAFLASYLCVQLATLTEVCGPDVSMLYSVPSFVQRSAFSATPCISAASPLFCAPSPPPFSQMLRHRHCYMFFQMSIISSSIGQMFMCFVSPLVVFSFHRNEWLFSCLQCNPTQRASVTTDAQVC
jgi:hypothetical protein